MANKIFTSGMVPKYPFPNAPKWIKMNISIKIDDFIKFLQEHKTESGWLNIDIKESGQTAGKLYGELNTYKKGEKADTKQEETNRAELNNLGNEPMDEIVASEIPF